jgi:hypothetical protein
MQRICAALVLGPLISVPVGASEKSDVMTVVQQFDDAFNKGDRATLVASCADSAFILDDFVPNEWHGVGACGKWFDDYGAFGKANDITDGRVTFKKTVALQKGNSGWHITAWSWSDGADIAKAVPAQNSPAADKAAPAK